MQNNRALMASLLFKAMEKMASDKNFRGKGKQGPSKARDYRPDVSRAVEVLREDYNLSLK